MDALIVVLVLVWFVLPIGAVVGLLRLRHRIVVLEQRLEVSGSVDTPVVATRSSAATADPPAVTATLDVPVLPAETPSAPPPPRKAERITHPPSRDWESVLGGSLLNRLGSVALVIAAVFLLNLAFERNWHAPSGPLLLGLGEAVLLIAWGWRLARGRDRMFGQGFVGTGLAVAFATVHVSHGVHAALAPWVALGLLLAIALAGVGLAHRLASQPVALLALLGGFLAPLLVRPESGPWAVWVYVATLDVLALGLGDRRHWRWLDAVALIGTQITWIAWASERGSGIDAVPAMLALQATYLLFVLTPVLRRWARGRTLRADDVYLWAGSAGALLLWSGWVLQSVGSDGLGWIAVELSLVHLLLGVLARYRIEEADLARQGLLALALLFIVVAVPLELDALAVTAAWTGQGIIVTWLAARTRRDWLVWAAMAMLWLGMGHVLVHDLSRLADIDGAGPRPESLLVLLTCAAIFVAAEIARRNGLTLPPLRSTAGGSSLARWLALPAATLVAIVVGVELLAHSWVQVPPLSPGETAGTPEWREWSELRRASERWSQTALSIAWGLMGAGAIALGFWRHWKAARWFGLVLLLVVALKGVLFDLASLPTGYRVAVFLALGVLSMAVSWFYARRASERGEGCADEKAAEG